MSTEETPEQGQTEQSKQDCCNGGSEKPNVSYNIAEAPITIHRSMYDREGGWVSFTVRQPNSNSAFSEYADIVKKFAEHGYTLAPKQKAEAVPAPSSPIPPKEPNGKPKAPLPPKTAQQETTPPKPSGGNTGEDSGTDIVHSIVVGYNEKTGKVQTSFNVGNFRYPFKDSRDSQTIASLFDERLGWTPEYFEEPAKYDQLGGLMAEWYITKKGDTKYYNIKRIFDPSMP